MQRIISKILLLMIAVSIGAFLSADAHGAKSYNKTVHLMAGKADTVDLDGAVADVLVANPSIADVGTLRSNRLYIVGRAVGDTNVLAYDDVGNQIGNITVSVRMDDKNLQDTLREFFPDEKISAKTVKDNVVLSGFVSTPSVAGQVRDLAARFLVDKTLTLGDLMKVHGEQQVMLKVKVIEAKRSVLRELGVETMANGDAHAKYTGNDVGRTQATPFGIGTLISGGKGHFSAMLRALETNGLVNTLAEPNLTAISGETAGFLAGGEYPVPTGRDQNNNITIEFKQFGVSLNFTPTVLSKDRIAMHLSTEVSEKDSTNKVVLFNTEIDGLSVRRAETTVEMASGGTIMIAGLIKSDTLQSMNGLPGAQDLPIIGQLFKSKSFSRGETELLIIVTPYLVDPYAQPEAVTESNEPPVFQKNLEKIFTKSPEATIPKTSENVPMLKPVVPEKAATTARGELLSRRLQENIKKTYGDRITQKIGGGGGFRYIVD